MLEVAADVAPVAHGHVAAGDDGRDEPRAHRRIVVDLLLQQPDEHPAALRVADEHDAAAVVVVGQVVAPRRRHVAVGDRLAGRHRRRGAGQQAVDGHLAVHRRPHAADLGEARHLLNGHQLLLGGDLQVRVERALGADRRVHVEAVDRRRPRVADLLHADRSVGAEDRRGEIRGARIVGHARSAQPHRVSPSRRRAQARRRHDHERQQPARCPDAGAPGGGAAAIGRRAGGGEAVGHGELLWIAPNYHGDRQCDTNGKCLIMGGRVPDASAPSGVHMTVTRPLYAAAHATAPPPAGEAARAS